VGRGDAARAMDRGWEAAEAAVDGESVGSSRMYFKSRKRHSGRELLLASRRHTWRLGRRRRDVEQRGEGQRGVGSGDAGAWATRGTEESGAGQLVLGTWPARAVG
jgi:hypothetical protein